VTRRCSKEFTNQMLQPACAGRQAIWYGGHVSNPPRRRLPRLRSAGRPARARLPPLHDGLAESCGRRGGCGAGEP
jgi:hypothetical protein